MLGVSGLTQVDVGGVDQRSEHDSDYESPYGQGHWLLGDALERRQGREEVDYHILLRQDVGLLWSFNRVPGWHTDGLWGRHCLLQLSHIDRWGDG